MADCCATCRFFLPDADEIGECHSGEPVMSDSEFTGRWPDVRAWQWCGHFSPGDYADPEPQNPP